MKWLKLLIERRRLKKLLENEPFEIRRWRKQIEQDLKNIGDTIEYGYGGIYSPYRECKVKYEGIYKGKRVFKLLE